MIKGEGEHAVELVEGLLAPCRQRLEQHLGVARALKSAALRLQPLLEFAEVVDLPVEHQTIARAGMDHRLVAGGRKVEDRQPTEPQADDAVGR